MPDALLDVAGLSAGYGEGLVLEDVSLSLERGGSLAVLGRNGVGKSTLMLALMGHLPARAGRVAFRGRDITRMSPHARVRAGIGWVPQERECFPSLTVEEHLVIAARRGPWTRARIYELFPRLQERRRNFGTQLSGGEQQMLAIGRALATNPALLLLDEPMEGLAPVVVQEIASRIPFLMQQEGLAVILVEQHARLALDMTHHAMVLDRGRVVHAGTSAELVSDAALMEQHIGMRRMSGAEALAASRQARASEVL
ncbi:MAG TPA: ABC transporter ATP-binding protein [Acetobacteraceae bacterium]|jgi:branched-chain amino acid transport system ATP-binding protein|nr:ABC transporter ATP-binding protein [Acetobacteraceae bacterium]